MMWLHLIDRLGFHPGTGCDAHSFACRGKTRTTLDNRWEHRQVTQRTRTELTVNGHPLRWSSRHSRDWLCPALSVALLVHAEVVPVWQATNQASPLLRSHRANGRSMLPTGINKLFTCRSKLVKIASLRGLGRRALLARKHSLGPWSLSSAIAASFPGITSASSCDKVDHSVPQPVEPRSQHTGTISVLNCELEIIRGPPMAKDSASVTPWNRAVASGVDLLRNPRYNKGLAFDDEERNYYFLQGLLPPAVIPQDLQVMRIMENLQTIENPLHKYVAMMDLLERNEKLFYRVLIQFVEELLPIVYTPTVGEACQKYGVIFRRPHGLYISFKERCKVLDVIRNWPEDRVEVIVVTDGERILGLGDLGCQGMGIPCGKLNLYTALGGVHPTKCLPVTLDVGTNNRELLDDPYYIGLKQPRVAGEEYDGLVDEFMTAVKQAYGEKVLVQFEDFANHNAFRLLEKYAKTHLVFNDDIQGTAAVTLAGLVAALKGSGGSLADHRIMMLGAGEAGTGIAEMIAKEISRQGNIPLEEARKKIYLLDSKGLIVASRLDSLPQPYKRNYAHDNEFCPDLITAVKSLKPSILIGTSGQRAAFTREVLEAMASINKRPIILALSNPTSKSECTAEEAYNATEGRALFASGSPFGPVEINGKKILSAQANNAYIFPGLGLGCNISGAVRVHDEYFLEAAVALASEVTEEHINQGLLYPPFKGIRRISARIATAVARKAYDLGLATHLPEPENLLEYIENSMYAPDYDKYR